MANSVGSVEWFRHRPRAIVEHARAIDDFGAAARSFQKLSELGLSADAEIRVALHISGVIAYGRPFRGDITFPKRLISQDSDFRNEAHDQLLLLRDKLVAHSDREFADGRFFVKTIDVGNNSGTARSHPVGVAAMGRSVHSLEDLKLLDAYLLQAKAALRASSASIGAALQEFGSAAAQHPDAHAAARREKPPGKTINVGRFSLSSEQPHATVADVGLNLDELLSRPSLTLGADGYAYRLFGYRLDLTGPLSIKLKLPDGSDMDLHLSAAIRPPETKS